MKNAELKSLLVQNGVENEKKASGIINWHEIFGFFLIVVLCNIISVIFNISFGLLILVLAIVNAFLWRRFVEKNVNDTKKLSKTCKYMKIGTVLLLIALVIVFGIIFGGGYLY